MTKRFRLLMAAACGVLALLVCFGYGESVRAEAESDRAELLERYGGELVTVVCAAHDLEPGQQVDALTCEEREWVADLVPEGALTSLEDAMGMTLTSPVSAGTPLTDVAFREGSETLPIPEGSVAMALAVGEKTGVEASVAPGTELVAYRVIDGQISEVSTRLTVLGAQESSGGGTLTVAVPVADVSALIAAVADGSLRLVQPAEGLYGSAEEAEGAEDSQVGGTEEPSAEGAAPTSVPVVGDGEDATEGVGAPAENPDTNDGGAGAGTVGDEASEGWL